PRPRLFRRSPAPSPPFRWTRAGYTPACEPGQASGRPAPAKGHERRYVMADEATPPAGQAGTPDTPVKPAPTLVYEGPTMREAAEQLREKKASFREGGGAERVERQRSLGKLTVRERLDLPFDPGTFDECGLLAHHQGPSPHM